MAKPILQASPGAPALPTLFVSHGSPTFALRPGAAGAGAMGKVRQLLATSRVNGLTDNG